MHQKYNCVTTAVILSMPSVLSCIDWISINNICRDVNGPTITMTMMHAVFFFKQPTALAVC